MTEYSAVGDEAEEFEGSLDVQRDTDNVSGDDGDQTENAPVVQAEVIENTLGHHEHSNLSDFQSSDFSPEDDSVKPLMNDKKGRSKDRSRKEKMKKLKWICGVFQMISCSTINVLFFLPLPGVLGIWGLILMIVSATSSPISNYNQCYLRSLEILVLILSIFYLIGVILTIFDTFRIIALQIIPKWVVDEYNLKTWIYVIWIIFKIFFSLLYSVFIVLSTIAFVEFVSCNLADTEASGFEKSILGHFGAFVVVAFVASIIASIVLIVSGIITAIRDIRACTGISFGMMLFAIAFFCVAMFVLGGEDLDSLEDDTSSS